LLLPLAGVVIETSPWACKTAAQSLNNPENKLDSVSWTRSLAFLSLFMVEAAFAAGSGSNPLAEHVRAANDRFKDVAAVSADLSAVD
jgi:hypothetical protein